MRHHCVLLLYNRHRRPSTEHYYCCSSHYLSHADSLHHHHVDQNSNRVRCSTDDLVRTLFEMPTCPLERYLKLLNRWRPRTDRQLIHLNLSAKRARAMTIGSSRDLRNPTSVVWPSSAVWQCSSSWRFLVRRWCDDDTLNKDLLVSYKDMVQRPIPMYPSNHRPWLAALMSSCLPPPMRTTNWSNLLNFDDD